MARKRPTVEQIREFLSYDPSTGVFVWRKGRKAGAIAGYTRKTGYVVINILSMKHEAHRLAWVYMTGRWPDRLDHVDMNKANNSFKNLREALPWQNNANVRGRGDFMKGVTLHKRTGKYQAQIKLGGRNFYLGLFESQETANAAYSGASKILFGEFARAE